MIVGEILFVLQKHGIFFGLGVKIRPIYYSLQRRNCHWPQTPEGGDISLDITSGYLQWLDLKAYLSTVTKGNSEDKILYLHVTQPLQIAAVMHMCRVVVPNHKDAKALVCLLACVAFALVW